MKRRYFLVVVLCIIVMLLAGSGVAVIDKTILPKGGLDINQAVELDCGTYYFWKNDGRDWLWYKISIEEDGDYCFYIKKTSEDIGVFMMGIFDRYQEKISYTEVSWYDKLIEVHLDANETYYIKIASAWGDVRADFAICTPTQHALPEEEILEQKATCTEDGYITYKCPVCQRERDERLPFTGHTPGEEEIIVPASCSQTGLKGIRCLECGEVLSSEEIATTDHVYGDWEIIREATYREPGYRIRTCEECGHVEEEEIVVPVPDNILEAGEYELELLDDGSARLIFYYGNDGAITIPESIADHTITAIARTAFETVDILKEIVIPDSIVYIEDGTFDHLYDYTMVVGRNSYARQFAIDHDIKFTYPDANDWLND